MLEVFDAPNMVVKTTLHVGQVGKMKEGRPLPAKVIFKNAKEVLQIYVPFSTSAGMRQCARDFAQQMCDYGEIERHRYESLLKDVLLEEDTAVLDDILSQERISGYEDHKYEPAFITMKELTGNAQHKKRDSLASLQNGTNTNRDDANKENRNPQTATTLTAQMDLDPREDEPLPAKTIRYQGFSTAEHSSTGPARATAATMKELHEAVQTVTIGAGNQLSVTRDRTDDHALLAEKGIFKHHVGPNKNPPTQTDRKGAMYDYACSFRPRKHANQLQPTRFVRPMSPNSTIQRAPIFKSQQDQQAELNTGVHGEMQVYELLKTIIGEEHATRSWTSELRHIALGGQAWTPDNATRIYCDFTITNAPASLQKYLLDEFSSAIPKSVTTVHIEVKTTAGPCSDPWQLSNAQMEFCEPVSVDHQLANRNDWTEVLIVLRVYDAESNLPKVAAIIDPWEKFGSGRLEKAVDGYLITDRGDDTGVA